MKRITTLAAAIALSSVSTAASAAVSQPFPGITLVTRPGTAMVIADLCAKGVSVRATKYEERKQTPEGWGASLGLAAAVNADFFDFPGWTHVQGRARGAGVDWPGGTQLVELANGEDRQYLQFGPRIAELVIPESKAPTAGATDIVGAHNVIIQNGVSLGPNFDGDAVILGAYRRTSIGVSKDRGKLYLFSSNNPLTGDQLANEVFSHASEGGAPNVDFATNEDGGGSAQLYVAGQGQLVTSGRLVANHLGVFATGQGDAPNCPSRPPSGAFDSADCAYVSGWAQDPDVPAQSIDVLLAFDGIYPNPNAKYATTPADYDRPDVGKVAGSSNHGFSFSTPFGLFDDADHPVLALGKDAEGLRSALLPGGPRTVHCKAAPPLSRKRHVANPTTYAAWKFNDFFDLMHVSDTVLASFAEASALDAPPELVRADDGSPEIWLVDHGTRRLVGSLRTARAWHFDLASASKKPTANVQAIPIAEPLRERPILAVGSGPAIYLLDVMPGEGMPRPGEDGGVSPPMDGGADAGDIPSDTGSDGCGCRAAPTASASLMLPSALGLFALALARRRRRR